MGGGAVVKARSQAWIRLVTPNGVLLWNGLGTSAVQNAATAPTCFTSSRLLATYVGALTADVCSSDLYLLTLAKGPGTFETSAGDEGGPMTNGATHAGTIYLGDLDQWSDRKSVV